MGKKMFKTGDDTNCLHEISFIKSLYTKNEISPIADSKHSTQKYTELSIKLQKIFEQIRDTDSVQLTTQFPFTALFSLSEMVLVSAIESPSIILEVMRPEYPCEYLVLHSLNVSFFCILIGMKLGLTYNELIELCVAGMVHDIGMIKLNKNNYLHERELSHDERYKIEEHPMIAWNFLKELRHEFPWLLKVVLEEHKRENNQGYPIQVTGELHLYSKIVGICDYYEALSHDRIFRKAFHPTDAMKMAMASGKNLFSKKILRAMIEAFSIYPVGSIVQLNNKKIALVVRSVNDAPMKPIVCIVEDVFGTLRLTSDCIDLSLDTNQYIINIVYADNYQLPRV